MSTNVCFFYWKIFTQFQYENYDFNLYKGFFMGKKWPKFTKIQIKKNSKSPKSYHNFQKVAKNKEGFYFFSHLNINYVAKFG